VDCVSSINEVGATSALVEPHFHAAQMNLRVHWQSGHRLQQRSQNGLQALQHLSQIRWWKVFH
jgi:hypothetical protein